MKRFESSVLARASLSWFVTDDELRVADHLAPGARKLLVPNVLPRADAERAATIRSARSESDTEPFLTYLGTLTYPPNLVALQSFLRHVWPELTRRVPGIRLRVVGASSAADVSSIASHADVDALGFVGDLTPVLARTSGVVFPFGGGGGSSLRVLFCALAGVPIVGSPAAFRGFGGDLGISARSPQEWAAAVYELHSRSPGVAARLMRARDAALRLQNARGPWDTLSTTLVVLMPGQR
jgi:hypothetical protein